MPQLFPRRRSKVNHAAVDRRWQHLHLVHVPGASMSQTAATPSSGQPMGGGHNHVRQLHLPFFHSLTGGRGPGAAYTSSPREDFEVGI